jgi:ribonuclease HI
MWLPCGSHVDSHVEEAKYKRILYTDASVDISSNPSGKAATGYIWWERLSYIPQSTKDVTDASNTTSKAAATEEWTEIARGSACIGHNHSSYSAEAIAIKIGLNSEPEESISTNTEVKHAGIGVFTDSLSNLRTIQGGLATTREQEKLLESIVRYPREITFHHVKAHHKNIRNKQVDALCNVAVNDPYRQDRSDLGGAKTAAKIKDWVKKHLSKQRSEAPLKPALLEESTTGKWIAKHVSKTGTTMHPRPTYYNLLPRREGILLAKARTYHWTNCMWFLSKIKVITCDSCRGNNSWRSVCTTCENCTFCGVKDDTEHALNSCNLHEQARTALLKNRGYVSKVTDLLMSEDAGETKELTLFLVKADDTRKGMCAAKGI